MFGRVAKRERNIHILIFPFVFLFFLQDGTDDEAGAVGENLVKKVIQALGAFARANFLIVGWST